MFSCVGLVYFQILLDCKTTASCLFYELGVNDEKKVNGNWDIINKNEHGTSHTGKPGNLNSLRDINLM